MKKINILSKHLVCFLMIVITGLGVLLSICSISIASETPGEYEKELQRGPGPSFPETTINVRVGETFSIELYSAPDKTIPIRFSGEVKRVWITNFSKKRLELIKKEYRDDPKANSVLLKARVKWQLSEGVTATGIDTFTFKAIKTGKTYIIANYVVPIHTSDLHYDVKFWVNVTK